MEPWKPGILEPAVALQSWVNLSRFCFVSIPFCISNFCFWHCCHCFTIYIQAFLMCWFFVVFSFVIVFNTSASKIRLNVSPCKCARPNIKKWRKNDVKFLTRERFNSMTTEHLTFCKHCCIAHHPCSGNGRCLRQMWKQFEAQRTLSSTVRDSSHVFVLVFWPLVKPCAREAGAGSATKGIGQAFPKRHLPPIK